MSSVPFSPLPLPLASFFALSPIFARPKLVRSPILGFLFAKNAQERLLRRLDTIIKCSSAAGTSSTLSEAATVSSVTGEEDPFANLDVTVDEELDNRVKQVAPGSGISAYLESEKILPGVR